MRDAERKTLTMLNIIVDASGKEQRQKEIITLVDDIDETIVFYDLVEKNGEKQEDEAHGNHTEKATERVTS